MPESSETLQIKGPKGIATFFLVLLAGGGIGATQLGTSANNGTNDFVSGDQVLLINFADL